RVARFILVALQLGLLALVIRYYNMENQVFYDQIMTLVFVGFLIHGVLTFRYRLGFFLLLSLAGIFGVFGWQNGGFLIGIGLVLIAICHLPASLPVRIVLLVLAAAYLGTLRTGWLHAPWSSAIWPILGSMFMFRLIAY